MKIDKYVKPSTLEEAYQWLMANPANRLLAGGAWLKLTNPELPVAIDLSGLGLMGITETVDEVVIGSMTPLRQLVTDPILAKQYDGILGEAASRIMGVGLQDIATLGGSIMGKFGFSDLLAPLLVMDARLVFFHHPEMTIADFLAQKEPLRDILTRIILIKTPARGYFHKVARTSLDFAVVNVAVAKIASGFRMAVGSRPGIAVSCPEAAKHLAFRSAWDEEVLAEAARIAAKECQCSTNSRASGEYREQLVKTYLVRGLKAVIVHEN